MSRGLRVLFVGMNHGLSLFSLEDIAGHGDLVGIVESVGDRAAARRARGKLDENLMHEASQRFHVPFQWCGRDEQVLARAIESTRCDILAVVGMIRRLPKSIYELPRLGAINLHPSLLPNYRGPDPYFWQYHQMDLRGGITVFQIDEGLDTGDILLQKPLPIELGEPYTSYLRRTAITGAQAMVETLDLLRDGRAQPRPQRDLPCPAFARMVRRYEPMIEWNLWPLERVWHLLHGMHERTKLLAPPPGVNGSWSIGPMVRGPVKGTFPGDIARDAEGHFVAHREGKIRLQLIPQPSLARRIVRRVRRMLKNR